MKRPEARILPVRRETEGLLETSSRPSADWTV
jgi:hypothetical protein